MNPDTATQTPNNSRNRLSAESAYRAAVGTAAVAGVFSLAVLVLLAADFGHRLLKDPLDSEDFKKLKAQLVERPNDDDLKAEIREIDLELRNAYFRQRQFAAAGSYLLLGGLAVFLVAARSAGALRRKLPAPEPFAGPRDTETRVHALARWSVAGLAVLLAVAVALLSVGFPTQLPGSAEELAAMYESKVPGPGTAEEPWYPSDEELRKNWPRFRGPDGSGISAYANVPTAWDGASGKGIVWKTPVPLEGNNSPIVWGDRVFLSGADKDRREVYSFDANSGKLLWQKPAPGPAKPPAKPLELDNESNAGWAASTLATDGRRVFAVFPVGELVALDFSGSQLWNRSLGVPVNSYGHASSLAMYRNLLLVQLDQGGAKDGLSRLLALEAATGKTVWEVKREVPNSWSTPIVAMVADRPQIITTADPWAIAYDPAGGQEIWRAKCLREDIGPSPVIAGGIVYTANRAPYLSAIRADGKGDVSKSHTLWTAEDGLPDTCSPLATGQYVLLLTSEGTMTCYDAKEGKRLWEKDFDATFKSSPGLVGTRIYLFSDEGKTWILQPGPKECKIVAESALEEGCATCPAFQDGRIYIRGKKHLFCIGGK